MNHPYPDAACNTDSSTDGLCNRHGLRDSWVIDPDDIVHKWHITPESLPSNGAGLALLAARGYRDPMRVNQNGEPIASFLPGARFLCQSCLENPCRCRFTVRWLDAEEEARVWREDHPHRQPRR